MVKEADASFNLCQLSVPVFSEFRNHSLIRHNILHKIFNELLHGKKKASFFKSALSLFLSHLTEKIPEILPLNEPLVNATIRVYSTITSSLLPTPAKSHYTFNLRDLSKVFQGILMAEAIKIEVRTNHRQGLLFHCTLPQAHYPIDRFHHPS